MTCFLLISSVFIISVMRLTNPVFTMPAQGILGGERAFVKQITYQVAVVRLPLDIGMMQLAGSGSIISKQHVLTIARCFVIFGITLGPYEYSIRAGTINWRFAAIPVLIDQIYLPGEGNYDVNNLAVASLKEKLDIDNSDVLSKIPISQYYDSFYERYGVVSGYGYDYITYNLSAASSSYGPKPSQAGSHDYLRWTDVFVMTGKNCGIRQAEIDTSKQFCGLVLKPLNEQASGLCNNDGGSPLVMDHKVIGIGNVIQHNCDDTDYGTAYTNVTAFAPFINAVLNNNTLPGTIILPNNIYVNEKLLSRVTAPAA